MKIIYLMVWVGLSLQTTVFAQTTLEKSNNVAQPSLLVTSEQKKKVEDFKKQETIQITNHREDLRKKRLLLKSKEELLLKDVTDSKVNGLLTTEQKESFKIRHLDIKKESEELSRLNSEFMNKIYEQRNKFYNVMK